MSLPDFKKWTEELSKLWRRRGSPQALIVLLLCLNFILIPFLGVRAHSLFDKLGYLNSPSEFAAFLRGGALSLALLNVMALLLWYLWRRVPAASAKKIVIFFAPSAEPGAEDLVATLYDRFKAELAAREIQGLVAHEMLPHSRRISDHKEAHDLLVQTGARLVVYGRLDRGKTKARAREGFRTISFCVRHSASGENSGQVIRSMAGAMAFRAFTYGEEDSFVERSVVTRNLAEVAVFFVAKSLLLEGDLARSLPILENLYGELAARTRVRGTDPQLQLFAQVVREDLVHGLRFKVTRTYDESLIDSITDRSVDKIAQQCADHLDRAFALDPNPLHDLDRAIFSFHFGRFREAQRFVENARRGASDQDPAPDLSAAFLALWEGRHEDAIRHYQLASHRTSIEPQMVVNVVRFLCSVLERHPENLAIRFGLAFVNGRFWDRQSGRDEFETFLRETEGDPTFEYLRDEARRELELLAEDEPNVRED